MTLTVNLGFRTEADFAATMRAVVEAGFHLSSADEHLGYASGTIESTDLPKLQRVPGVVIEADRSVAAI